MMRVLVLALAFCAPAGCSCNGDEPRTGRIPSCVDPDGIDVFAVEADEALSVTWNVNGTIDHAGGFAIVYGFDPGDYETSFEVAADRRETVLVPMQNDVEHFVAVQALDASGNVTFTSCEVSAIPHVLAFVGDHRVDTRTAGNQTRPDLASNFDGSRLYLAWQDAGGVVVAISGDLGDTWTELPFPSATGQASPAIAVRDRVLDPEGNVVTPEAVLVAWEQGGSIHVVRYDPDAGELTQPVVVAAGLAPDIDVGLSSVHLVFENGGAIHHAGSLDDGRTFQSPVPVSGTTTTAHAPSLAVDDLTGNVFVAWDARLGRGDTDIYFAASLDAGVSFGGVKRIDDDPLGQNQSNVSIAFDERNGELYATWEDRRGGANVYFALSADRGSTWSRNVDVGAGLGGDQFRPRAVVDVAHNVYVTFQDTTNGMRIVFTRFNSDGSFDPPLPPSSAAGAGGVAGDHPTVATDRFGTVYVAWEENRSGPDVDIFFARAE